MFFFRIVWVSSFSFFTSTGLAAGCFLASLPLNQGSALAGYAKPVVPLDQPTQYPEEPVTTGIPMGAGPGPEVLTSPAMVAAQNSEDVARLMAVLPIYARIAESPNASNAMRNFYRYLRSQV